MLPGQSRRLLSALLSECGLWGTLLDYWNYCIGRVCKLSAIGDGCREVTPSVRGDSETDKESSAIRQGRPVLPAGRSGPVEGRVYECVEIRRNQGKNRRGWRPPLPELQWVAVNRGRNTPCHWPNRERKNSKFSWGQGQMIAVIDGSGGQAMVRKQSEVIPVIQQRPPIPLFTVKLS